MYLHAGQLEKFKHGRICRLSIINNNSDTKYFAQIINNREDRFLQFGPEEAPKQVYV